MVTSDERYMARCIQLAKLGKGYVAPNPMVGCVIVSENKIIGEGYHQQYGQAHAEVNAIDSVENPSFLSQCTLYVNLEPCAHYGKTPPCANLIVRHQFRKVVIGTTDANEQVENRGIARLRNAGIEVIVGVLEKECLALNRHFFTFHLQKRPYILLKWAQTRQGWMDDSNGVPGDISWISGPEMQTRVHQWRRDHQAILVGKNTIVQDNPSLTVRNIHGNNPLRIVLDSEAVLDDQFTILNDGHPTLIMNERREGKKGAVQYIRTNTKDLSSVLSELFHQGILSILVEGGAKVLQSFLEHHTWDEARVIIGENEFIHGTHAPKIKGQPVSEEMFFNDRILTYLNQ